MEIIDENRFHQDESGVAVLGLPLGALCSEFIETVENCEHFYYLREQKNEEGNHLINIFLIPFLKI